VNSAEGRRNGRSHRFPVEVHPGKLSAISYTDFGLVVAVVYRGLGRRECAGNVSPLVRVR
jgi:hypothetical protein